MTRKGPVIDLLTWQEEVSRRVAVVGHGVHASLRFDAKADTAYTDGAAITCPLPPVDATYEDYQVLRGQVIHEVGHLARPEVFSLVKARKIDMRSKLGILVNQIEDRVQEAITAGAHKGDRISLDRLHAITTTRQQAKLAKDGLAADCDVDATAKLWATLLIGVLGASWMEETHRVCNAGRHLLSRRIPSTLDWIETLTLEGWGERINRHQTVEDVFSLAQELHKRLFPDDPDPTSEKAAGAAEAVPVGGTIPWWLLTMSDHTDKEGSEHPSRIDWTGKEYNERVPDLITDVQVHTTFQGEQSLHSEIAAAAGEGRFPASLVGEVRRRLQAKTRCRWRGEKLEGRLDTRNITRLVLPQVGDGTYNRSIFRKKDQGLKLDVSVSVLVDSSGSMAGDKYVNASVAAMALNELCERALRVPSEIIGFSHSIHRSTPEMFIHKSFSQKAVSRQRLVDTLGSQTVRLSGNSDAEAVMFAVQRLRKQSTARKVLIVLSDGAPADSKDHSYSTAFDNLKKIISMVRRAGDVELYGIGIADTNVRKFYSPSAPVVKRASDVGPALLNVLNDVLQKQPEV